MARLHDLVREELAEVANSGSLPADLGDRALAAGQQRRRRRQAVGMAALCVAGVASTATLVSAPIGTTSPADVTDGNAVFAYFGPPGVLLDVGDGVEVADRGGPSRWHVVNPTTGDYREIDVATMTAPTTDLRYAAVTAPWQVARTHFTEADHEVSPEKKIGRYDATTGDIRWHDVPVFLGTAPRISPDGRFAVAAPENTSSRPEDSLRKLVLLNLDTGRADLIDVDPADAAAASRTITVGPQISYQKTHPGDGLNWHPDSRHVIVGNAIIDLHGRRTGTLPVPDNSLMVSVRLDGAGMLIEPGAAGAPEVGVDRTYALTDISGEITRRVILRGCPSTVANRQGTPSAAGAPATTIASTSPSDPSSAGPTDLPSASFSDLPSGRPPATPPWAHDVCPRIGFNTFLGWRGTNSILVDSGLGSRRWSAIVAVDLRTGKQETVHLIGPLDPYVGPPPFLIIVPSERLSDQARHRVGF